MSSSRRSYWRVLGGSTLIFFCLFLVNMTGYRWSSDGEFLIGSILSQPSMIGSSPNNATKYAEVSLSEASAQGSESEGRSPAYNDTSAATIVHINASNSSSLDFNQTTTQAPPTSPTTSTSTPTPFPAFANVLLEFDWTDFSANTDQSDNKQRRTKEQIEKIESRQEDLMRLITPYLVMEPLVSINGTCSPPLFTPPLELKCEGHGNVFTGQVRSDVPPKIGILIQFGFGVDVLEIYLNEVYDLVDRFFIIESTRAHFRTIKKGLLWERVKHQPRFLKFADKVIHLVIDDAEVAATDEVYQASIHEDRAFEMESLQERLRWTKFVEWNAAHKFFGDYDLLGMGDADEIPASEMIHMMRHCQLNTNRFDMGIWFSFGNVKHAFRTDWPVPGHRYTLGDPTFWTLEAATAYASSTGPPSRMRGRSGHYLLGGVHMTHSGYLPFQIARRISCSECWSILPDEISSIVDHLNDGELRAVERHFAAVPDAYAPRNVDLDAVADEVREIAILPWFYACNRDRYPSWEGRHDTRLD